MRKLFIPIATVVSLCLLGILLITTTPVTAGPFGVLAIFLFAYLSILGLVTYTIFGFCYLISHLSLIFMARRPIEPLTLRMSYFYSSVISAVPILIIGLQSVGRVGIYEYLLVVIFAVIGCFYIYKKIH